MWPLALLATLLLSGCSVQDGPEADAPEPRPAVQGFVLDHLLRPVEGAHVTGGGNTTRAGPDGAYALFTNATDLTIIVEASGFLPATRQVSLDAPGQQVGVNFTLRPIRDDGYLRLEPLRGFITCGAIAQVGHSHSSGDPGEDNHVDCEEIGGQHQNRWTIRAHDEAPTDMLFEIAWDANTEHSRFLTAVLYDDEGEVMVFVEGDSILRLELATLKVQEYFQDGREAELLILPGIQEEQDPEVFLGLHFQQEFDVYFTTFYGMQMPPGYSVAS